MIVTIIQRAVVQGIPLLFGSTGEIITEKSGNLNLGIPGIMYVLLIVLFFSSILLSPFQISFYFLVLYDGVIQVRSL